MICEESSTNANSNQVILDVCPMMKGGKEEDKEIQSKCKEKESQFCKNSLKKRSDFET
jgi:hypothetical protein